MPRATIWITEENYPLWQDIENKSAWINMMLRLAEAELIEIEGVNDVEPRTGQNKPSSPTTSS